MSFGGCKASQLSFLSSMDGDATDDDDVMEGIDEPVADATVAGTELGATSGYTAQALRSIGSSFHLFFREAKETPNPPDSAGGTKEDESSV